MKSFPGARGVSRGLQRLALSPHSRSRTSPRHARALFPSRTRRFRFRQRQKARAPGTAPEASVPSASLQRLAGLFFRVVLPRERVPEPRVHAVPEPPGSRRRHAKRGQSSVRFDGTHVLVRLDERRIPNQPLMAQSLGGAFVLDMAIQLVGWAAAATMQTEKFYDLFGSLAFASTAITSFVSSPQAPRQALITGMVCAWTARLGAFLARRVVRDGGDSRFDEVKVTCSGHVLGVLAHAGRLGVDHGVALLPDQRASLAERLAAPGDYVSLALWLFGIAFETAADAQKSAAKPTPRTGGALRRRRAVERLEAPQLLRRDPGLAGRLRGRAQRQRISRASQSGARVPRERRAAAHEGLRDPHPEKSADERWGSEAKYQEYKRSTPCLVPRLPGWGSAKAV